MQPSESQQATPPLEHYRQRQAALAAEAAGQERASRWYGHGRLASALSVIIALWATAERQAPAAWAGLSLGAFAILCVLHERLKARLAIVLRARAFVDAGAARLQGDWVGQGQYRADFVPEGHLYAADLDLFGKGSLFERLCRARTRVGEESLARVLLTAHERTCIRERQQAVAELRERPDLFEHLAAVLPGTSLLDHRAMQAWATAPLQMRHPWMRRVAATFGNLSLASLGAWSLGAPCLPFVVLFLVAQIVDSLVWAQTRAALSDVEGSRQDLLRLQALLRAFDGVHLASDLGGRLLAEIGPGPLNGQTSGALALAELERHMQLLEARRNPFFQPFGIVMLWNTRMAYAIESWRRVHGAMVARWLQALGELECLLSLACYSWENPGDPFPELLDEGGGVEALGLVHPLISPSQAIRNDLRLGPPSLMLVSGSNMAGKSSWLRAIGVNVVLAQAGTVVRAHSMRLGVVRLGASLLVSDSLHAGVSRFYAELLRLRAVLEACAEPIPVLFLLDEIMHGTNSHDRAIGASAVLQALVERGALGLATTHDLALSDVVRRLPGRAVNVHFADTLRDGRLHFDYRLRDGIVEHSNALALMRAVGLQVGGEENLLPDRNAMRGTPEAP